MMLGHIYSYHSAARFVGNIVLSVLSCPKSNPATLGTIGRVRKVKIRPLNFGQITTGASRAHRYLINRTPIPVLSASFGGELHDLPPIRD